MGLYQKAILLRVTITNSLNCKHLELWCLQETKIKQYATHCWRSLSNHAVRSSAWHRCFVAEAMRLSPNLTPTQALKLLQSCIQIMPKTGGNSRPIGRPGWFLLSASDRYFKRTWSNTFDFLPHHWQNQHQSVSRRTFNRTKPRASHF